MIKKNLIKQDNILLDFYKLFYNEDFPVLLRYYCFKSNNWTSKFLIGYDYILKTIAPKRDVYISVYNKIGKNNYEGDVRSTRYFVIDIDSDFKIPVKSAKKITQGFNYLNFYDYCPRPTAIVASGHGFHFYYQIDEVFLLKSKYHKNEDEYKHKNEKLLNILNDTSQVIKEAIQKAIDHSRPIFKNLTKEEKLIADSLKVDQAVGTSKEQLIRAPGSYNHKAEQRTDILYFNENIKYRLSDLLIDYRPKHKKISNKIIEIKPKGFYSKEESVNLNFRRLNDVYKLIEYRKNNGTLIGTRQKIMTTSAWLITNINHNSEENINELEELMNIGKIIGSEFKTKKFCESKLKHVEKYYKKRPKLKNNTIRKWLDISEDEKPLLKGLNPNREEERLIKREQKEKEKKEILDWYYANGENKTATALKFNKNRKTIHRWLQNIEEK